MISFQLIVLSMDTLVKIYLLKINWKICSKSSTSLWRWKMESVKLIKQRNWELKSPNCGGKVFCKLLALLGIYLHVVICDPGYNLLCLVINRLVLWVLETWRASWPVLKWKSFLCFVSFGFQYSEWGHVMWSAEIEAFCRPKIWCTMLECS